MVQIDLGRVSVRDANELIRDLGAKGEDIEVLMQCHVGQCVTGIATQDPVHERRYNPVAEARNIHRYLEGVRWQIAALTQALGHASTRALKRDDLVALTRDAAEMTGLPYAPEYRAQEQALQSRMG